MTLSLESQVSRRTDVLTSNVGDEIVMLDVERGFYYGLDPVATRVWELLTEPVRVADLCARLIDEFEVTPEVCTADVTAFLEDLRESGLLDVREM